MIGLARRLAAGPGHRQRQLRTGRRADPSFPAGSFDVAISRTGTMFFGDPAAAFTNIGRRFAQAGGW
jgi:hypothetical protein